MVDERFVLTLIDDIKQLKADCGVETAEHILEDVGRVTLQRISEYYEDL